MDNSTPNTENKSSFWQALGLAWELGYTIAIPLVVFALAGRLADKAWGTSPWFLLAGVILSIIISSYAIVRKLQEITLSAEREAKKDNNQSETKS